MSDSKKSTSSYAQTVKEDEFFLITQFVTRRLAYPLTIAAKALGISANAVTIMGGLLWVISVPLTIAAGWCMGEGLHTAGWIFLFSAAALWHLGLLLDVVDGSLARLSKQSGLAGSYLDFTFHLVFNPMLLAALGVCIALATGHPAYFILAVLSVCVNWGLSMAAKEHTLCESIAKDKLFPASLSSRDRYEIFINSVRTRKPVAGKSSGLRLVLALAEEFLCFPGQYASLTVVFVVDWIAFRMGHGGLILMQVAFISMTLLMLARVPFRIKREFRTLCRLERILNEER